MRMTKANVSAAAEITLSLFGSFAQFGLYFAGINIAGESVSVNVLFQLPVPVPVARTSSSYHGHSSLPPGLHELTSQSTVEVVGVVTMRFLPVPPVAKVAEPESDRTPLEVREKAGFVFATPYELRRLPGRD